MITKEIAVSLPRRRVLNHVSEKGSDGQPKRCRVNGAARTWVNKPDDFSLPVKAGLYEFGYITPANASEWVLA